MFSGYLIFSNRNKVLFLKNKRYCWIETRPAFRQLSESSSIESTFIGCMTDGQTEIKNLTRRIQKLEASVGGVGRQLTKELRKY